MIQTFIVILLFVLAVAYISCLFYREFAREEGCGGCASCGGTDTLKKIHHQIEKQNQETILK